MKDWGWTLEQFALGCLALIVAVGVRHRGRGGASAAANRRLVEYGHSPDT